MNLVKWLRRNNKKVMAVVVIVIMFGFIGGSYIQQLGQKRTRYRTVAYFLDNRRITNYDINLARQELDILKMLRADFLLKNIPLPGTRMPDLQKLLLGELLFPDQRTAPAVINEIARLARMNSYNVSDRQIYDIYERPMPSDIYWLLLKKEAELAGIRFSNEYAGRQLAGVIPDLWEGASYKQLISSLMNQQRIAEKDILRAFATLLAVLQYTSMVCSSQDITNPQMMYDVSRQEERIDVEFVKFDSSAFAETQDQPSQEQMSEHFEKYKAFYANDISKENPYGFGYKLPSRVRLEYMAVKFDDISAIATQPTSEEKVDYYHSHKEEFMESVPSDPNDPNSPPTQRIIDYPRVAAIISRLLLQRRIDAKANMILQQAKTLTEAALDDVESEDLTSDLFRQLAGDYKAAADQLSKEHQTNVYTGQTGLLSASDIQDIQKDTYLGRLYVEGYGHNPPQFINLVGLPKIVFSIDELGTGERGPFDPPKPRMYENIGPLKDPRGQVMALMRVIEANEASVPESINHTHSTSTLQLEQDPNEKSDDVYSVKENIAEDLKKLAAMDTTKNKTKEFVKQIVLDGWDDAIEKFNQLYEQEKEDPNDPNAFSLQEHLGRRRLTRQIIDAWTVQNIGNPIGHVLVNKLKTDAELMDRLYALVPHDQDSNSLETVPYIMEFEPEMSYYCIKDLTVRRLNQDDYEKVKPLQFYRQELSQSQSLAFVHFNPENIIERINFREVREEEPEDANAPAEPKGTS
jgi:hypothetical protein